MNTLQWKPKVPTVRIERNMFAFPGGTASPGMAQYMLAAHQKKHLLKIAETIPSL